MRNASVVTPPTPMLRRPIVWILLPSLLIFLAFFATFPGAFGVNSSAVLSVIKHESGHLYSADIPGGFSGYKKRVFLPGDYPVLLENGIRLPRPGAWKEEIASEGEGRFRVAGRRVLFSSSDLTPPDQNGRSYTLVSAGLRVSESLLICLWGLAGVALILSAIRLYQLLPKPSPRQVVAPVVRAARSGASRALLSGRSILALAQRLGNRLSSVPMPNFPKIPRWLSRGFALILLTSIFTVLCVSESRHNGRLASAPNYDDCVYFFDGALLLKEIKNSGFSGISTFLDQRGLHSPYSVFMAAASFAFFGPHETSPYYGDGLVVLLYLGGLGWILRRLSTPSWILALGLFLTPPFITMGVVEFRPDIAWAVMTGFGVVWIVTPDRLFRRPGAAALAGVFAALAFLIKPSTFVMTTLLFLGAVLSRPLGVLISRKGPGSPVSALPGAAAFLGALLVVAGPYWWRYGNDAWAYFWENSFGANKQIWAYQGSLSESLLFYITGEATRSNVAISGQIIGILALACAVYLVLCRPELRWRIFVLFASLAGALLVNTVAQMKSPFLGGGIYGVWLFGSAFLMAETYRTLFDDSRASRAGRGWSVALLGACLIAGLLGYRWPDYSNWGKDRVRCDNYRAANDHMRDLLDRHMDSPPKSILFTQAEPIVMEDAGLWFAFHNLSARFGSVALNRTEKEFIDSYPSYDWLVMQEPGVMGFSENMPSEALLPRFLEIVKADPHYRAISEFTSMNGKKVWIFERSGER